MPPALAWHLLDIVFSGLLRIIIPKTPFLLGFRDVLGSHRTLYWWRRRPFNRSVKGVLYIAFAMLIVLVTHTTYSQDVFVYPACSI